jgi:hypothetical protein
MSKRPSLLRRIFSRLSGEKATQPPQSKEQSKTERPKRRTESSFEPLEGRIAPAILISPTTVQYKDSQGDIVTVKFSKPLFEAGTGLDALLDRVFKFDTGNVRTGGNMDTAQVLQTLDFTGVTVTPLDQASSAANGVSVSITAEPANGLGDGLVDVGYIKATQSALNGITLGKVLVEGDLGRIDAGTALKPQGLQSLIVNSLGTLGTSTQAAGGSLNSTIYGTVGTFDVNDDVKDAIVSIENGNVVNGKVLKGSIGNLLIRGKLSTTANVTTTGLGSFTVDGDIGKLTIGTLPDDGIFGGSGPNSGRIHAAGKIGSVIVKGDIRGSAGKDSGEISGDQGIGSVSLQFSLFAGSGENSGRIVSSQGAIGKMSLLAIRGESAVNGGAAGKNAGTISAATGIESITLTGVGTEGKILGGAGEGSGSITVGNGTLGKLTMQGSLAGGGGLRSGSVFASDIRSATIGEIFGGGGAESGVLRVSNDLGPVKIESLRGGTGNESGVVRAGGDLKSVFINQTLIGNGGTESGSIRAGDIGSLTIKNSANSPDAITAGTGIRSGYVGVGDAGVVTISGAINGATPGAKDGGGSISIAGNLGTLTIPKGLIGGVSEANGAVVVEGKAGGIFIGENLVGAAGGYSGSISVGGAAKTITILGNVTGGSGIGSAGIFVGTDFVIPDSLGSLTIRGSVLGGDGDNSAFISASGVIVKATIGNSAAAISDTLKGGVGISSGSISGGAGIGSLVILGNVAGGDGGGSGGLHSGGVAKSLVISGNLSGGAGAFSGSVRVVDSTAGIGNITSLKLGALLGGTGNDSGQIRADGTIASLSLSQATGAVGHRSGSILAGMGDPTVVGGILKFGAIGTVKITGGLQSGAGDESGAIISNGNLTSLSIGGVVSGSEIVSGGSILSFSSGALQSVEMSAVSGIAKLKVVGGVTASTILAGYDRFGNALNGDAQIGSVSVSGDWAGSTMAAGVLDVDSNGFGNADDTVIPGSNAATVSRIASVIITGNVVGRADGGQVGFVAQQIDSLSIAGAKVALTSAKNTIVLTTSLNEITIREVA